MISPWNFKSKRVSLFFVAYRNFTMDILFLSDNFPPEMNAPASRTYEHTREWVKAGHSVTVITCAPNFPEGKVFDGYRNSWYQTEEIDGIRVIRVKTYITSNSGFAKRTLDYMSFMVMGFLAGLLQRRPDVVIGTSPQFFTIVGAWLLSVFKWRPFIFELRDLWPASIVTVGAMKEGGLIRFLKKVEMFLYRRAKAIVPVTKSFKLELVSRGIAGDKIATVVNGVDQSRYRPTTKDSELETQYGLKDKFVVGYLGTHGLAHALDKVIDAATLLRDHNDIVFLFAGGGAKQQELLERVERSGLSNVVMLPPQPKELMPRIWSLCDISVVPLKNDPVFSTVIPSKIFECMGMGIPMIMSVPEGEATGIINKTQTGITIPPENPDVLAETVLSLKNDTNRLAILRNNCLQAAPLFERKKQAKRMLQILVSVLEGKSVEIGSLVEPY